ncbi:hypothetical protein ACF059_29010 [Streptomyces sp. NPDC016562]|uniref:hypothetical protein n=1 Tax=Streptomyces sp. NPDC016562 TaxID=3364966 RepID=UPI0037007FC2
MLEAFAECGDGGRDDLQELGGLRAELGQSPGEHLQRRGRILYGAGTPPLGSGCGVGERTHRDDGLLGQRLHVARCGRQLHVLPNEV